MIPRYTLPEMGALWSEQNKFQKWLDVELAVCEAWAERGQVPGEVLPILREGKVDIKLMAEYEKQTDHDVIAFLQLRGNVAVERSVSALVRGDYDSVDPHCGAVIDRAVESKLRRQEAAFVRPASHADDAGALELADLRGDRARRARRA